MKYIPAKDVAKILRKHLKANFPQGKFSVKTDRSTGSLRVRIKDESADYDAVQAIARMYAGCGFDGMIDYRYSKSIYLNENGFACGGKSEGSTCTGGIVEAYDDAPANAELVNPLTSFVFVN